MKLMCICGKYANYIKDDNFETFGWYSFDCECGEKFAAPKNNPNIIHEEEQ
jgi:hypothetical protein